MGLYDLGFTQKSEKKLRQLFRNRSDCYIDTTDDSIMQGMSEDLFIEVMGEALTTVGTVKLEPKADNADD